MPYARYIPGEKAIIIIGNDGNSEVTFTIDIPLELMKMHGWDKYCVTNLWDDSTEIIKKEDMDTLKATVPADYTPGGGVRAIKIEPVKS